MLILGAHMSIANGFTQAAKKTGEEFAANAMQIFTKSPRGGNIKPIDPADAENFKKLCDKHKINYIIAHSSYLLNFAKPVKKVPWMLRDILTDFARLQKLGGRGVVVHIGKHLDSEIQEGIKNVIENAKYIIDQTEKTGRPLRCHYWGRGYWF